MDVQEHRTDDFEGGQNGEQFEIKDDENKIEENETKSDLTTVNCKQERAVKEDSMSALEGEEGKIENDPLVDDKEHEKTELSNLEITKPVNGSVTSKEKSEETEIKAKLTETDVEEKGIQTDVLELEERATQTEQLPKEEKDDCTPTLMQELLQQIECPVCFDYMVPPITHCSNGHNICKTCKPELRQCPTCRGSLYAVKNNTAETLSKSITHPCKFRKSGCAGQFLVDFKDTHEGECQYGPHKCPFYIVNKCQWEGPIKNMRKHIENTHKDEGDTFNTEGKVTSYNPNFKKHINGGYWWQVVFTLDDIFFYHAKIINSFMDICFMHVASKENPNNYKFTISIKSLDDKQSASSCLKCPNYLEFIDKKFPCQKCAVFTIELAKQCVNEQDQMFYEYEISQY